NELESQLAAMMALHVDAARIRLRRADGELVERTCRATAELIRRAERGGDEIALGQALQLHAIAHVYSDRSEIALTSAQEALAVADSIGAGVLADAARTAIGYALAGMAAAGGRDPMPVAHELRQAIDDAQGRNDRWMALNNLAP